MKVIRGDVDNNGSVTLFDLVHARRGLTEGFTDAYSEKAADIDRSGSVQVNDLVLLQKYLLGAVNGFTAE
ncbi:dockerin type I repeat-containing protein [Ruminococcus sp. XPD3002]|uniref:dockerin type I repeat-containing protein n=1 Tax=Ruminococcus sp. XPD3002 TaxID=1452269 RepID=UPI00331305EE